MDLHIQFWEPAMSSALSPLSPGHDHARGGAPADPLRHLQNPPRTGVLGVSIFTAGLGVAFVWLLVGYVVTRQRAGVASLDVPMVFWFSTFVVLVSSVLVEYAVLLAGRGMGKGQMRALRGAAVLGLVFLVLQAPGLVALLDEHGPGPASVYRFTLVLVVIHALHVLGGMIKLVGLALAGPADRPTLARLRPLAIYWHFLAVVWLAMFSVFHWA
jgi:cytochrome c oxidase subunit III